LIGGAVLRRHACLAVLCALLGSLAALANTGTVIDEHGKPVKGAKVCYLVSGGEALCVDTDARGRYALPPSPVPRVSIKAPGYLPRHVTSLVQEEPIRLEPAASIRITLLDASTGKPISGGSLWIIRTTGKQLGPLPTREAGMVQFLTLEPGTVVVTGEADGYEKAASETVELVAHDEADVLIRLKPSGE
jgi:hypothetical protein